MTLQLDIVDTDLTSVLLNLNGVGQGNSTGFEVKSWNLGQVTPETEYISNPAYPGAIQTVTHHGPVDMELILKSQSTTYDLERTLVGSLVQYLRNGGLMRYKVDGQTNYRYIEFFGAQLPQLLRGEIDVTQKYIVEQFRDPTGVPLVIPRQPYVFEATRQILVNEDVANDDSTSLMTLEATVVGDLPALAKIQVAVPSSSAEGVQVRMGRKSTGDLDEYRTSFVRYEITSPNAVTVPWKMIHRNVLTPVDPSALEGSYRVFASLKLDGEDTYRVQLRWGTVDEQPAGAVNDEVVLDNIDTSVMNDYADVDLGVVRFDRSGSCLALEIWARSDLTASDIDWLDVWLLPVDEAAINITVPGFRFGLFGREVTTGNELSLAGGATRDDDDRVVLRDNDQYCQTANVKLAAGMHLIQFIGTVYNQARERFQIGRMQVYEDDSPMPDNSIKLMSRRKYTRTHYDADRPKQVSWKVTDTSKNYRWRVTQIVSDDDRRRIKVWRIIHSFIPILASGRRFVIDGIEREVYCADSTGARFFPAHMTGTFMTLEPGDNILVFRLGEASTRTVYRDVDSRGALAEMHPTRGMEITIDVRERFIV